MGVKMTFSYIFQKNNLTTCFESKLCKFHPLKMGIYPLLLPQVWGNSYPKMGFPPFFKMGP